MRRILVMSCVVAAVLVLALVAVGPASAGTPQSPQSVTYLVTTPDGSTFYVTSPTLPSAAGVGTPMAVIPQGIFHGRMPQNLVMICTFTDPSGNVIEGVPVLLAPTTH